MKRALALSYGLACYAMFGATYLYMAGFVGNLWVPKSIDSGQAGAPAIALLVNTLLVLVFGLQHSVMARPTFKRMWTKIVPKPVERATYVLFSNIALILLMALWQPLPATVWSVESTVGQAVLYGLFALGWLAVPAVSVLINHLELFGVQQVWQYFRGKETSRPKFVMPAVYGRVRHPLYVAWLTAFWCTPTMSVGHLLFAVANTAYILVAIYFEERNLVEEHGEQYADYRRNVPMLVPRVLGGTRQRETVRTPSSVA